MRLGTSAILHDLCDDPLGHLAAFRVGPPVDGAAARRPDRDKFAPRRTPGAKRPQSRSIVRDPGRPSGGLSVVEHWDIENEIGDFVVMGGHRRRSDQTRPCVDGCLNPRLSGDFPI
jgi:hypothetical protein